MIFIRSTSFVSICKITLIHVNVKKNKAFMPVFCKIRIFSSSEIFRNFWVLDIWFSRWENAAVSALRFSADSVRNNAACKDSVFTDHMPIQISEYASVCIRQPGRLNLHSCQWIFNSCNYQFFGGVRNPDNSHSPYFYEDQMISMPSYLLVSIIRYCAVINFPHEKAHSPDGPCAFDVSFCWCSYSTVTLLARFLGLSTFRPFATLR